MTFVALAAIALLAFGIEGAVGFGGTVIAASLGGQLLPLDELLPAFVPLNLALSAYLLVSGRDAIAWRILLVELAPPIAVGAAVGLALFHIPAKAALALGLGVFVVGLAVLQLVRPATRPLGRAGKLAMLVTGGIAHGLFGTGGPMIVYVARRRLADKSRERATRSSAEGGAKVDDKREFRATLAVLWFVLNLALLVNFATLDLYTRDTGSLAVLVAATLLPGLALGERVHRALDPARFERVVWTLLLVAGAALAVRSAFAL